jgi:hypothetical protein
MPPSSSDPRISLLRRAAQRRVDEIGLRAAADEIGMSFSGLRTFLAGTSPHQITVTRISRWAAAHAPPGDLERLEVFSVATRLAGKLPSEIAEGAAVDLVRLMAEWMLEWCEDTDTPAPSWAVEAANSNR